MNYDPFDPAIAADPYPVYNWLRDEAPAHHAADTDTYVFSRYDDVSWGLGAVDVLSSDAMRGVLLGQPTGDGKNALPREQAMGTLVAVDAPGHTELRRIVNRGFTPRRVESWHERIDEIVGSLIAAAQPGEPFDAVSGLAGPLPVQIIAELLGADPNDAGDFRRWADSMTSVMSGSARSGGMDGDTMMAALELATYLGARIGERIEHPADDLLSALVRAHGEETLSREEAVGFAGLLLFAGSETSTNLIGNALMALLQHPDQLEAVTADPTLVSAVLEETLRWESPVQYVFRRATEPFERHGVSVPVDATVTLVLGAANRDPRRWGNTAAEFDIDRRDPGHVAFGFGPHFCLGAALARAEASAALGALLPLVDGARVIDPGTESIDSVQFRGRKHISFVPAGT